jgi:acyl carrier protein
VLSELVSREGGQSKRQQRVSLVDRIEALPAGKRFDFLLNHIRELVNEVLGFDSSHSIDSRRGFFELGMDSLLALELKNRIQTGLGYSYMLNSTVVFDYPTIESLARFLAEEAFGLRSAPEGEASKTVGGGPDDGDSAKIVEMLKGIKGLSNDELLRILAEKQ